MPFCGFDKQMLDGLDKFHEGLIETIIEKSKEENRMLIKCHQVDLVKKP